MKEARAQDRKPPALRQPTTVVRESILFLSKVLERTQYTTDTTVVAQ